MRGPTRRQMYAEQTRTDLTAAARKLFVEKGFAGTSVEAVTAAAQVSKGTFYHHFPDKKAMFAELYTELAQQAAALSDAAAQAVSGMPDASALALVADLTHAFLRRTIDDPLHRELMVQAPSVLGPEYRHINDTVAQPPIERLLTALAERGDLKSDVPVATVARLLLSGLCEGNQIIAAAPDREEALTRTFRAITLLVSGLAADTGSAFG
ncbi:helix-turn-helix domain-containing protein [Streptomyces sp. Li-HN-5-11]|uniref:TetR/AcrR family transcriptional regulator n=1 Tax=Streptomyces sp. Li-HN-5-11 TaxID=3075432 RepID=UPI0028A75C1F|nr:helix-turn-helix domain-containing protein [Streptomyces sp. Li-HN-5-11]WNM34771.1 helix-turn-helix domain-containing protein [Streptomyces sp. Li-HN-5-11]